MITDEQLQTFCKEVHEKIVAYYAKQFPSLTAEKISFMRGPKFARIVRKNDGEKYGSCFCFVDLANGNILKADGWKRPAPQVRGNIANGAADVTPYGAKYLK